MKNIREILFAKYADEVDAAAPTAADEEFSMILCELETVDAPLSDRICDAATVVLNEQMKKAYMAGFSAAVAARRATT